MRSYHAEVDEFDFVEKDGLLFVENRFVRWAHDPLRGGELVEAVVKNGRNENLLRDAQSSSLGKYLKGTWRQNRHYATSNSTSSTFSFKKENGTCRVEFSSELKDDAGETFDDVMVHHSVEYHSCGSAEHCVTLELSSDACDLGQIRIGTLYLSNTLNTLAVRPSAMANWAIELQEPCHWIKLEHAKSRLDLPAYRSRFLPLSMLLAESGVEGIEIALGDDLAAWENVACDLPGMCQGSVYESRNLTCYEVVLAVLESPREGNVLKKGKYSFRYRMALPFVKKKIVPVMTSGSFLRTSRPFAERWHTDESLKRLSDLGVGLMKLHNDGDYADNGIFWRDADYPPYNEPEMKNMNSSLEIAKKYGIDVVPYFSVKEYHSDAPGFDADAESFARRVIPDEKFLTNFFGKSLFGMQMCLESAWYDRRRETIAHVLENHAFNGMYYDWCMGLECINSSHCNGHHHWDNDRLTHLLEWSRAKAGANGRLFLHLTNVPSLAIENMGDLILTEESEYTEIFPEMFTPHVHFLNIAPRMICVMIPIDDEVKRKGLLLAALLHHATLCSDSEEVLEFYQANAEFFNRTCDYIRHWAPGENRTWSVNPKIGISVYWKSDKIMIVAANLSNTLEKTKWRVNVPAFDETGEIEIEPLAFKIIEVVGK